LVNLIATRNVAAIVDGINDMDIRVSMALVPTFESLWLRDATEYPNLPWDVLELPVIRLTIARQLINAHFNGVQTDEISSIHAYLREQVDSRNESAAISATSMLDRFNDPEDVVILEGLWARNGLRRAVMASLNMMCIAEADVVAERLLAGCTDSVCNEIREARAEAVAWKEGGPWCSDFDASQ